MSIETEVPVGIPRVRWVTLRMAEIIAIWAGNYALYRWGIEGLISAANALWLVGGSFVLALAITLRVVRVRLDRRQPLDYTVRMSLLVNWLHTLGMVSFAFVLARTLSVSDRPLASALIGGAMLGMLGGKLVYLGERVLLHCAGNPMVVIGADLFALGALLLLFGHDIAGHLHPATTACVAALVYMSVISTLALAVRRRPAAPPIAGHGGVAVS